MMYATITSIRLKGPFHFFKLSYLALSIVKQLKQDPGCRQYRSRGFWTMHYTMSLWQSEQSLKDFARRGAHLEGMKFSKDIASEICTYSYPADQLPDWKTAKMFLKKGKVLTF